MTSPFDFDDQDKDDPKEVANLLSNELMQLSISDRTAIQEEIHGVKCLAPEETPLLLDSSLRQLAAELNQLPDDIGKAYRQSQKLPHTYVNTLAFRLRFLRCELFNIKRSAVRMANFLNLVLEYFGEYALERPIRLSDLNREELKYLRRGRIQWLPFRDRSGRRIMIIFPGKRMDSGPERIKTKASIYMGWTVGNSVDQQLQGIVVLVWFDKSFEMMEPLKNKVKLHEVATGRICAFHVCTPDTAYFRFRRAVTTMRAAHLRMKMRMHIGDTMELIYTLQGYGIPTDTIPITYSGTVKIQAMRQWMRLRNFLEEPLYQNTEEIRSVIECPYPNDIVFRQGTSILTHPGNATFRAMIASKFDEIEKRFNDGATNSQQANDIINKLGTRILVREVMEEMQRSNMRVLNWNDAQGFWKVLNDTSQIYLKVEYLVREHRNSIKALTNRKHVESSTSLFRSQERSGCFGGSGNSSLLPMNGGFEKKNNTSECFGMKFFDFPIRTGK